MKNTHMSYYCVYIVIARVALKHSWVVGPDQPWVRGLTLRCVARACPCDIEHGLHALHKQKEELVISHLNKGRIILLFLFLLEHFRRKMHSGLELRKRNNKIYGAGSKRKSMLRNS